LRHCLTYPAFEHVTSWLDDLRSHADENVSIILVANKTDLCAAEPTPLPQIQFGQAIPMDQAGAVPAARTSVDEGSAGGDSASGATKPAAKLRPRTVSTLEGALFAKQHNVLYVETSAKEGWGVVDAFEWTARQILERVERGQFERRKPRNVDVNGQSKKGGCC
jgi:Ras-related protein Rab-2A/Rab family protein